MREYIIRIRRHSTGTVTASMTPTKKPGADHGRTSTSTSTSTSTLTKRIPQDCIEILYGRRGWGLLQTNYPKEFSKHIPRKNDNDRQFKTSIWFVDSPVGETVASGFKSKRDAIVYKNVYVPNGFVRCYNPTIADHEKNLSDRRQELRFQSLSTGPKRWIDK